MRIEALSKYQRRRSKGSYFEDLPPDVRDRARHWLNRIIEKRRTYGKPVRGWAFGILVGQAKRLALHPPTSEWGHSMLAKRGGYAVQVRYRGEGRHPTAKATRVRLARQRPAVAATSAVARPQPAPASSQGRLCATVIGGQVIPGRLRIRQ